MKNLLEAAEDYTKQAGWRDLAELKCCMFALEAKRERLAFCCKK